MTPEYQRHQAASYRAGDPLVITPDQLAGGSFQVQFGGSQPLGCTARSLGNDRSEMFVMSYFEPCIFRLVWTSTPDGGFSVAIQAIRGADHGTDSVRAGFVGVPGGPFGQENRAFSVSVTRDGQLWVNRSDRVLFLLDRPANADDPKARWKVALRVQLEDGWNDRRWVHSMRVLPDSSGFDVIEGPSNGVGVACTRYNPIGGVIVNGWALPANNLVYGWGAGWQGDDQPWFVTDTRCNGALGLFHGTKLVMSDESDHGDVVGGTGVCFLHDGTAVITQYGQGYPGPFNGREGRLTIIPAHVITAALAAIG